MTGTVLGFRFSSPVRRLDSSQTSGGLGNNTPRNGLLRRRLTFRLVGAKSFVGWATSCPPIIELPRGHCVSTLHGSISPVRRRVAAANRGRLLWVTFLGKARKVTSRRAAPGEFSSTQAPC